MASWIRVERSVPGEFVHVKSLAVGLFMLASHASASGVRAQSLAATPLAVATTWIGWTSTTLQNVPGAEPWQLWWSLNREHFLRPAVSFEGPGCPSGIPWPATEYDARDDRLRPSAKFIDGRVQPALVKALELQGQCESPDPSIVASCLVALSKCRTRGSDDVRGLILPWLASEDQAILEATVIALGQLSEERNVPLLEALLINDERALRAQAPELRTPITERIRACAAFALAETASRVDVELRQAIAAVLVGVVEDDAGGVTRDLRIACVTALGLIRLPFGGPVSLPAGSHPPDSTRLRPVSTEELVLWLLHHLGREDIPDLERAQVPIALARQLYGARCLDALRERVGARLIHVIQTDGSLAVVSSCLLALGELGDSDGDAVDVRIRELLLDVAVRNEHAATAGIALLAIGHVAGRAGHEEVGELWGVETAASARAFLTRELRATQPSRRAWAALSLAVLERALALGQGEAAPESRAALLEALSGASAPEEFAPLALAVGIAGIRSASAELRARLVRSRSPAILGAAALALGLIRDSPAAPLILEALRRTKFHPDAVSPAAEGLSLIGNASDVLALVEALGMVSGRSSHAAIAAALERLGDYRSLDPLVRLLEDPDRTYDARGCAAAVLGDIAGLSPVLWSEQAAAGANFIAPAPILFSPETWTGLLDRMR
jgi:HEAT repeat protein